MRRGVVVAVVALVAAAGCSPGPTGEPEAATTTTSARSTTTTAGPGPPQRTGDIPIRDDDQQRVELVLFGSGDPGHSDDDEVVLTTLTGAELGRGPRGGWYTNRLDLGVDLERRSGTVAVTVGPVVDEPPTGCSTAHGAAGVLAAACGPEPDTDEIRLIDPEGGSRALAGPVADLGHWRFALVSPDGKWVLGQWSGECEEPAAYLIDVRSGERRPVVQGVAVSTAIGWTPGNRAIVGLPVAACGAGSNSPSAYLVDPSPGTRRRLHPYWEGARVTGQWFAANRLERIMDRARRELGLDVCCNQPSHGGGDAEDGIVFERHDIEVYAVPLDELRDMERRLGELRFSCGGARYFLFDYGPSGSTNENDPPDPDLLERAARRLTTRLYCTPGPFEISPPVG
ncbi:MAG: hypothetical protein ACRDPR_08320 [Nocardioidaceae bacterium]